MDNREVCTGQLAKIVDLSMAVPKYLYEYEGLEGLCFNVANGHNYEIRPSEASYESNSGHREDQPKYKSVQIWDSTDSTIVGEYETGDLENTFNLESYSVVLL